jgi:hypothetical protein
MRRRIAGSSSSRVIFVTDCGGRVMLAEAMAAEHPKKVPAWAVQTID